MFYTFLKPFEIDEMHLKTLTHYKIRQKISIKTCICFSVTNLIIYNMIIYTMNVRQKIRYKWKIKLLQLQQKMNRKTSTFGINNYYWKRQCIEIILFLHKVKISHFSWFFFNDNDIQKSSPSEKKSLVYRLWVKNWCKY